MFYGCLMFYGDGSHAITTMIILFAQKESFKVTHSFEIIKSRIHIFAKFGVPSTSEEFPNDNMTAFAVIFVSFIDPFHQR